MNELVILQIVGFSGAGKTSLITDLVKEFSDRDFKVVTIKSAKQHKYNFTKKDSDQFLKVGSEISIAVFQDSTQLTFNKEMPLEEILKLVIEFSKPNIVLIEGYKTFNFDKVVIWTKELAEEADSFNFNGIKYLFCEQENYKKNQHQISMLKKKHSFLLETNLDRLKKKIVEEYC